ncbi:ExeA family protein [Oceanobacter mangrovi]|uniref:ExeA family protein n=1 Tax=Oceanobacter mangrovi TaxID=2862510 RepID=UPI001C8D4619|nr:ExeA family protein [Oceanobacter mangrovi]
MYLSHFGLERFPFTIAPDPSFLFPSAGHQEALAHLQYALTGHGGLVCLTGEVGTGKTTLCRAFLEQTGDEFKTAYIFNPLLSPLELMRALFDELELPWQAEDSQQTLYRQLNEALLGWYADGKRVICLIDEAQAMPAATLEQVRLLTNLETSHHKLLTLILVGQPELREVLASHQLRQLSQRITARYHLNHLQPAETADYLAHRLKLAGCEQNVFEPAACEVIWQGSKGIPRLINSVADRALLGAFAQGKQHVDRATAKTALTEVLGAPDSVAQTDSAATAVPAVTATDRKLRQLSWLTSGLALCVLVLLLQQAGGLDSVRTQLASWIAPSAYDQNTNTPQTNPQPATNTAQPPDSLAMSAAEPSALPPESEKDRAAKFLSGSMGLVAGDCETLAVEDWHCLEVEWPAQQLAGVQYQLVIRQNNAWVYGPDWFADHAANASNQKALLLWQPPVGYQQAIYPGQSSLVVDWVRRALGVAAHANWEVIGPSGEKPLTLDPLVYDPITQIQVARFQAENGLNADRIIGPQTLIYIQRQLQQQAQQSQQANSDDGGDS